MRRRKRLAHQRLKPDSMSKGEIVLEDVTVYWGDPEIPMVSTSQHRNEDEEVDSLSGSKHSKNSEKSLRTDAVRDVEGEEIERLPQPILNDLNWKVQSGELCAIVGRVGRYVWGMN